MGHRMHRYLAIAALAGLALDSPALAGQAGPGEQRREEWQKVDEIFRAMLVKPGAVVADVGAGDGFFTARLSAAVGPEGKVMAVDIGDSALRRIRARSADEKWTNVEVIEGQVDDPRLPAGSLDAILIVNAYHEMTEHQAMLARMKAALKPQGRLVIVEPISRARRDGTRAEQTRNHQIAIDYVKQDAREAGFTHVLTQDPFTVRRHGHEGEEHEEWILVLTPASAPASMGGAPARFPWPPRPTTGGRSPSRNQR